MKERSCFLVWAFFYGGFKRLVGDGAKETPVLFKHIFHSINGIDMLGILEKLYKIKVLKNIADSLAMTLFDAKHRNTFRSSKAITF
jgi:hypothetical protein